MNTFQILMVAAKINGMTNEELQVLAECLNSKNGNKLIDYISFSNQNKEYENVYSAD